MRWTPFHGPDCTIQGIWSDRDLFEAHWQCSASIFVNKHDESQNMYQTRSISEGPLLFGN